MKHSLNGVVFSVLVLTVAGSMVSAAPVVNGNFSSPATLGPGQTDLPATINAERYVAPGAASGLYSVGVSAIPGWTQRVATDGSSGVGLVYTPIGDPVGNRAAFINWWNARLTQVLTENAVAGSTYIARAQIGMRLDTPTQARAGTFQLWAGTLNPSDLDQFSASSTLLGEVRVGSAAWTSSPIDVQLTDLQWSTVTISATVPAGSPAIGKPLAVSFQLANSSAGPLVIDNVSVIPEPAAATLMMTALAVLRRKR
jgi:hypothetical protein